ncbi:MAG: hypothetical protein ABJA80_16645 [bacterium]
MDHERQDEPGQGDTRDQAAPPARPQSRRRWGLVLILGIVVVPLLLLTAWTTFALHWHYSAGNRAGYIQKFSDKGWLCKTWEGELAMVNLPGASQERFAFTVRDDSLAHAVTRLMGGHVSIQYEEHRGVPTTCFGDTQYYVTGITAIP